MGRIVCGLLLVGCFGYSLALQKTYDYKPPYGDGGDPPSLGCCWPNRFTAKLLSSGGYPEHIPGVAQIDRTLYYDLPNNRWGVEFSVEFFNGEQVRSIWLEDYNKKRQVQVRGKTCDYKDLDTKADLKKICVNDASRHVEKLRYGAKNEVIGYDVYEWDELAAGLGEITFNIGVTIPTCLPIIESGWWRDGNYTAHQSLEFTDIEINPRSLNRFFNAVEKKHVCRQARETEAPRDANRWNPERVHQYLRARLRDILPEEVEAAKKVAEAYKKRDEEWRKHMEEKMKKKQEEKKQ